MTITVVILVKDEALHIKRAISSVASFADRIFVIDSGSTDETVAICRGVGVDVLTNPFRSQAQQFNWALEQLPADTEWVLRLDADEVVTEQLALALVAKLPALSLEIGGVVVHRRMTFLRKTIRWGGVFPVSIVRVFRYGRGCCEDRWMDEHIIVDGKTIRIEGEIIDDNLKSLTWWIDKHNKYANREVLAVLYERGYLQSSSLPVQSSANLVSGNRWLKDNLYMRLPLGFRAFAYFLHRYIIRLGFLDGHEGFAFHFLQGFWYRYLVDLKFSEVRAELKKGNMEMFEIVRKVLEIDLESQHRS